MDWPQLGVMLLGELQPSFAGLCTVRTHATASRHCRPLPQPAAAAFQRFRMPDRETVQAAASGLTRGRTAVWGAASRDLGPSASCNACEFAELIAVHGGNRAHLVFRKVKRDL